MDRVAFFGVQKRELNKADSMIWNTIFIVTKLETSMQPACLAARSNNHHVMGISRAHGSEI
jgi:hypothetical protein